MINIDPYKRYQKNLSLIQLYPSIKGKCACGCGESLTGRKTRWADPDHVKYCLVNFGIIKGDVSMIRWQLAIRDKTRCKRCNHKGDPWEADHIFPVYKGGGGCTLENFQTLCYWCHKGKTKLKQ